ncbi:hypothetical protein BKA61DRAFT_578395 [Leptodontidium sp. MPI-SDFR-AT-0119]|nr:hypothetical protein BKA61DRAFT_578395 [Leptodontidium sp. MPI-SDFR-AT-0119]
MSGVEAGFVIRLISGVISIIEATKTVYNGAKDTKVQPEASRQVAAQLPLVIEILYSAEGKVLALDKTALDAIEQTLESCKAKAKNLQKIFQKYCTREASTWPRTKTAKEGRQPTIAAIKWAELEEDLPATPSMAQRMSHVVLTCPLATLESRDTTRTMAKDHGDDTNDEDDAYAELLRC